MQRDDPRAGRDDRAPGLRGRQALVPMQVDLKFGRNWARRHTQLGRADRGASAQTQAGSRAQTRACAQARSQACCGSSSERPEPARTRCSPAPAASAVGEPPAAPAAHHNGTNIRDQVRAQSSIAFPAFDVREATTIDLADLIDEPVPTNRKICCPLPRRNNAEPAHLSRSLLLLRLRRLWRSYRLADAGRGPRLRPRRATSSTTGTAR